MIKPHNAKQNVDRMQLVSSLLSLDLEKVGENTQEGSVAIDGRHLFTIILLEAYSVPSSNE